MAVYPVRCCCTPTKVIGHLLLPDGLHDGQRHHVMERIPFPSGKDGAMKSRQSNVANHLVLMRRYRELKNGIDEITVYSDDRQIEFWRKIVGFTEVVARAGLEPASPSL